MARRDPVSGRLTLDCTRRTRVVAAVLGLFATALLALGVYVAPQLTAPGAALLLAIFGVMWLMAVHTAHDTFAVVIEFSDEGLVRRGVFGRIATIPWSRVGRVDYSYQGNW